MLINTPCVIFAGGKSSRMGEDKALLPFSSFKTLTEFQQTRLEKIFQNVYISCKNRQKFDFDAHFIEESENIYAPTLGFISAFTQLKTDKIFVLSVDTPFVTQEIIEKIFQADNGSYDAVIAKTQEGIQPMCGLYSASLVCAFKKMKDENSHKLGLLLKNVDTKYVFFDESEAFFNLNHPHEYKQALTLV